MAEVTTANQDSSIIHRMGGSPAASQPSQAFSLLLILVSLVFGIISGFVLSQVAGGRSPLGSKQEVAQGGVAEIKRGQVYGAKDERAFRDQADGDLEKGGLDGEGSHKLVRPGGESQTAYLTSSTLELDKFVGRKIKVWGETYKPQKAGWFMDVGRVEVLE